MSNFEEVRILLKDLGFPPAQQAEVAVYTLLALSQIKPTSNWNSATNNWIRIHDVIEFSREYYGKEYAENSRETIRKQCMHPFREAALIEDNGLATNSPHYRYKLTNEALNLIKSINADDYDSNLSTYLKTHETLIDKYKSKKKMKMMPVRINNEDLEFSPGEHNKLQKDIIEKFAPRFAPNCVCLYVGDTINKNLINNTEKLKELGFEIIIHDTMPDIILYREDKDWIFFIEAVASSGAMTPERINKINAMTREVKSGKIFVTAFPSFLLYKKVSSQLAWETEVWLADMPDHMIHLNGDRFLGPRK